jgi:hypothetical protein
MLERLVLTQSSTVRIVPLALWLSALGLANACLVLQAAIKAKLERHTASTVTLAKLSLPLGLETAALAPQVCSSQLRLN